MAKRGSNCAGYVPREDRQHRQPQRKYSLQNPNDPRFRLMKDHVINLEIPMYKRASISWLGASLREEVDRVVEMRDLAHGFVGLYVGDGGLCQAEGFEEGDLAVVEAGGFAEGGEIDGGGRGAVEAGELADCVVPPG